MAAFISLTSGLDAVTYVHTATCGKVTAPKKGWSTEPAIEAADAKAAQAVMVARYARIGRDDIAVNICPCAKRVGK